MAFLLGSRLTVDRPLPNYLREVIQHFKAVELHTDPKYFSPHFTFTSQEKKTLAVYRESYGFYLTMHAPFVNVRLGALNIEERQLGINLILHAMRNASDLGIKYVTFHPCTLEPANPEAYPENCLLEEGSIALLLRQAKELGVTLLLENMPRVPEFHPRSADYSRSQELLWLFPDAEFGLTVDIGHALQADVPLESLLKMERVRHFHLHDNDRLTDKHLPFLPENAEWWRKTIRLLRRKFPEAIGILEMSNLEDQLASLGKLQPEGSKKRTTPKINRDQLIPPILQV